MSIDSATLHCPVCDKRFRGRPELAGRKLRCPGCDAKLRVPASGGGDFELLEPPPEPVAVEAEPPDAASGGYDLDMDEPAPAGPGVCPSCNQAVKLNAVLCVNCGYDLKQGTRIQTRVGVAEAADGPAPRRGKKKKNKGEEAPAPAAPAPASPFSGAGTGRLDTEALHEELEREYRRKEVVYPLVLLGVGAAFALFNAFLLFPNAIEANEFAAFLAPSGRLGRALAYFKLLVAEITTSLPLLVGGIFVTAALYSAAYGSLGKAIVKLLALILVVQGVENSIYLVVDIYTGGWGGIAFMLVASVSVAVFTILAIVLFDMDVTEALTLWFIALIGPMFIMMVIKPTLEAWGIPVI